MVGTAAPTYLVTAYRWGCTNEHAYHVYAGSDRTKAIALANSENADRGGKYGCVVWEFDADGIDYKKIAYFGAMRDGENAPYHNYRIDFFERVGAFAIEAAGGKALIPDPKNDKHMVYAEVGPLPDYLLAEIERQRGFMKVMAEIHEKPTTKTS